MTGRFFYGKTSDSILSISMRSIVCSGRVAGCVVQEEVSVFALLRVYLHDTGRNTHLDSAASTYYSAFSQRTAKQRLRRERSMATYSNMIISHCLS